MFGYVRPFRGEMLVKEYAAYKAVYCGLCDALGKHYGRFSRFALSYDCTFYAILAMQIRSARLCAEKKCCTCNPLKKCTYLCPAEGDGSAAECYRKAAALCVIMTVYKLRDNMEDEGLLKRIGARVLHGLTKGAMKKTGRDFPEMAEAVRKMTEDQRAAETAETVSVDWCAAPTAELLETLFSDLSTDGGERRVLGQLGYFLGRWVYLMDASDDLVKDVEQGRFNPFAERLGLVKYRGQALPEDVRKAAEAECNAVLNGTLARMGPAVSLLPGGQFTGILENILKLGLPEIQREILFLHVKEKRNGRSV